MNSAYLAIRPAPHPLTLPSLPAFPRLLSIARRVLETIRLLQCCTPGRQRQSMSDRPPHPIRLPARQGCGCATGQSKRGFVRRRWRLGLSLCYPAPPIPSTWNQGRGRHRRGIQIHNCMTRAISAGLCALSAWKLLGPEYCAAGRSLSHRLQSSSTAVPASTPRALHAALLNAPHSRPRAPLRRNSTCRVLPTRRRGWRASPTRRT